MVEGVTLRVKITRRKRREVSVSLQSIVMVKGMDLVDMEVLCFYTWLLPM